MTMDRSPRRNYLPETLDNFTRAGGFAAEQFHSLHIVDSGSPTASGWPDAGIFDIAYMYADQRPDFNDRPRVFVHRTEVRRLACENAAAALDAGLMTDAKWILFCEDDLDFCGDFLESVARWLEDHVEDRFRIYPFGAAYEHVQTAARNLRTSWEYPVDHFYGTQCFAIRRDDAKSLADYWRLNPIVCGKNSPGAYDLMLQDWSRREYPELRHFLTSAPSFVQHIGRDSIATGIKETHKFPWPGPMWAYSNEVIRTI